MDVEGMLRSVQSKDYIKFSLAAIEKGIALCRQRAHESGLAFEQMVKSETNFWFEIRIFNNQNYSDFLSTKSDSENQNYYVLIKPEFWIVIILIFN